MTQTEWLMRQVLDGLRFPAQKWQLLAQADINGVDGVNRERIRRLPEGVYRDLRTVAAAIDNGRA